MHNSVASWSFNSQIAMALGHAHASHNLLWTLATPSIHHTSAMQLAACRFEDEGPDTTQASECGVESVSGVIWGSSGEVPDEESNSQLGQNRPAKGPHKPSA